MKKLVKKYVEHCAEVKKETYDKYVNAPEFKTWEEIYAAN